MYWNVVVSMIKREVANLAVTLRRYRNQMRGTKEEIRRRKLERPLERPAKNVCFSDALFLAGFVLLFSFSSNVIHVALRDHVLATLSL